MPTDTGRSQGLIFVEDPGAVNCVAPILADLAAAGFPADVLAAGHATRLLTQRSVRSLEVESEAHAHELYRQKNPRWVLVGTAENLDTYAFELIRMGRGAGSATIGFVDSAANAESRFRGRTSSPLMHAPDWLLLPDSWTATAFTSIGYPADRALVVGHPHEDHLRAEAQRLLREGRGAVRSRCLPSAVHGRTVVVFASEISTGLAPDQYLRSAEYSLTGRGRSQLRTQIVVEEFLDGIDALVNGGLPRPYLILRLHPKDSGFELQSHLPEFDSVSSAGNVLELLFAADLVVGMSSMLLQESHALGTPTLSILPREIEKTWLPILRDGATPVATDSQTVHALLRASLEAPVGTRREPLGFRSGEDTRSCSERVIAALRSICSPWEAEH